MRARSTLERTVSPPRLVCSSSSLVASLDVSSISTLSFLHDSCATPRVNRCSSPTIDRVPSTLSSHTVSKPQSRAPKRRAPPRLSRLRRRRRETRRSISSAFDPRARVEASPQSIPISRISFISNRRTTSLSSFSSSRLPRVDSAASVPESTLSDSSTTRVSRTFDEMDEMDERDERDERDDERDGVERRSVVVPVSLSLGPPRRGRPVL